MELVSPDGKVTIKPHPSKVEYYLERGWTEPKPKKASKKKELIEEVVQEAIEETKESE
jgi:hypothetical protein